MTEIPTIQTKPATIIQAALLRGLIVGGTPLVVQLPVKTKPAVWLALTRQRTGRALVMTRKVVARIVSANYFSNYQEELLSISSKENLPIAVWHSPVEMRYFLAVDGMFQNAEPDDLPVGKVAISVLHDEGHKVTG